MSPLTVSMPPPICARSSVMPPLTVSTRPPTFMLFSNRALPVGHSYRRFLENRLREEYELSGVPVRLVVRRRERRDEAAAR